MNPGEERKREEKRGLGFCDGLDKNSITKETNTTVEEIEIIMTTADGLILFFIPTTKLTAK